MPTRLPAHGPTRRAYAERGSESASSNAAICRLCPWARMRGALEEFPRDYSQIPPMHSALKQGGRPLYEYARAGETRERAPRQIRIHAMRLIDWQSPDLCFDVQCTKGAYMRVLAEDLAARLDTLGHLTGLRRLGVAPFTDAPNGLCRPWTACPGRSARRYCCRRCGACELAEAGSGRRQGPGRSPGAEHRSAARGAREGAHLCAGARISRVGGRGGRRPAGAAAADFRRDESSLRASPAARTMRAFPKGLSY